jgi:hypothetical protein
MTRFLKLSAAAAALAGLAAGDISGLSRAVAAAPDGNPLTFTTDASDNAGGDEATGGASPLVTGSDNAARASFTRVTRGFLIGHWTDNDDCTSTVAFLRDGRFVTARREGLWLLEGDQLTMRGSSRVTVRVHAPDANTIMLTYRDGRLGRSTRCRD